MDLLERGRFAPTPSGALHIGSARTAVASALAAWRDGGQWVLRVEDLDTTRTPSGAIEAMYEDLRWLGLQWDEGPETHQPHGPYLQSQRQGLYAEALTMLRSRGLAYPCACSRKEIELASQAPHGAEPVYPGTCRTRDPNDVVAQAQQQGRGVAWRFLVSDPARIVTVHDLCAGVFTQNVATEVGDFVIFRADGVAAYQLAVVVDDIAMEITEVVRGDDLLTSTPRQVLLYEALGAMVPRWMHVPLVLGVEGERLAKRHRAMSLRDLRTNGHSADALLHDILRSLGATPSDHLRRSATQWSSQQIPPMPIHWNVSKERFVTS
jgi:glutamyl-tRNA synthetase